MKSYFRDFENGWTLIADECDLGRWREEDILHMFHRLTGILSREEYDFEYEFRCIVGFKDQPDCDMILYKYPPGSSDRVGLMYIRRPELIPPSGRFKIIFPEDHELN